MLEREFGNPEHIGNSIGRSKGRVRTLIPRRGRRWAVRAAVTLAVLLSVRWAVAEAFYIPSASLAPILPQGSRCLVFKLANHFQPGDVVVYRAGAHNFVGSVVAVEPSGALRLHRNQSPEVSVPLSDIVGRVVLNTR
jgi:signal peptidase I